MAKKLFDYENPINGKKSNLLDIHGFGQLVLGGVVVLGALALSEKALGFISGKSHINLQPNAPFQQPATNQNTGPSITVL